MLLATSNFRQFEKIKNNVSALTLKLLTIDLYSKQQFVQLVGGYSHAKFGELVVSGCYGNPEKVPFLAVFCLNFAVLAIHYTSSYSIGNSIKRKFDSFSLKDDQKVYSVITSLYTS